MQGLLFEEKLNTIRLRIARSQALKSSAMWWRDLMS
jgi:hypothetical protein